MVLVVIILDASVIIKLEVHDRIDYNNYYYGILQPPKYLLVIFSLSLSIHIGESLLTSLFTFLLIN